MLGFQELLVFCTYLHEIPSPRFLNYVSVAASTYQHGNTSPSSPKATPRTGKPLFWVTSPLRHTPICVLREEGGWGGGRNLDSLADNLCHSLKFSSLPHAIPHRWVFYNLFFLRVQVCTVLLFLKTISFPFFYMYTFQIMP